MLLLKWFPIIILFFSIQVFGQYTKREADVYFKNGLYYVALERYLKVYEKDSFNVELNYNMGLCYLLSKLHKSDAIPYLEFVEQQEDRSDYIYYDLGHAYLYDNQPDKAIESLQKYMQLEDKSDNISEAKKLIAYAENFKKYKEKPLNVTFLNLGDDINSEKSETTPFISDDGSTLIYTTDNKFMATFGVYIHNIYASEYKRADWRRSKNIGSRVNTVDDEFLVGYSSSNEMILTKLNRWDIYEDIMLFELRGLSAREQFNPGKNVNSKDAESGACLSSSGDTLYFSSDRPDGFGGFDLYYCMQLPTGEWGIPANLGPVINSEFDEDYPNITSDGKTIYFASNNMNSMGGFDIFYSNRSENNEWTLPKNVGYPINDPYDNYTLSLTSNGRHGYVSLNKKEGIGEYDIYKVVFNDMDPTINIRKGIVYLVNKDTFPMHQIDTTLRINVKDRNTHIVFGKYSFNPKTSKYLIALPPGKFQLEIDHPHVKKYKESFEIPDEHKDHNIILNKDIYLRGEI